MKTHSTLFDILKYRATESPDGIALISEMRNWSFEELFEDTQKIAHLLREKCHKKSHFPYLAKPDIKVGIIMENGPYLSLSILAATLVGTAIPINPNFKEAELNDSIKRLEVDVLIMDLHQQQAVEVPRRIPYFIINDLKLEALPQPSTPFNHPPKANHIALKLMTSGSTGKPKIVPLSHKNICASAQDIVTSLSLSASDVCLSMWELYHIGGLVDLLLAPILSGGAVISTSGFNTETFFHIISQQKVTWFQAVPTSLNEIIFVIQKEKKGFAHKMRLIRSVAAHLPPSVAEELQNTFKTPIIQTFGMTEAGPLITSTSLSKEKNKPGSLGQSGSTQICILTEDNKKCATGEIGEIAIRGDNVFSGYHREHKQDEESTRENAKRFHRGWFLTGDRGSLDSEGYLFLEGRSKELINRGGEKINPTEVEAVIRNYPNIRDVAIFSVPHKTLGEDSVAAVTLDSQTDTAFNEDSLKQYIGSNLADFKVPQRIITLTEFPKTPVGKIDRIQLAEHYSQSSVSSQGSETASPIEQEILDIWRNELDLENIGLDDNFFILGGDSLSGMRLLTAIEKFHQKQLSPSILIEGPTPRQMAAALLTSKQDATLERR